MRKISRLALFGALTLIFLSSACGGSLRPMPTPVWTVPPQGQTQISTDMALPVTATSTSVTPGIPITGENVVSMQCQFCVEDQTHAILIFPEFAYFDVVSSSPVNCLTADIVNDRRILICRGTQSSSFELDICSDPENCLQYPVALQECPLLGAGIGLPTVTPFFLTAVTTLVAPTKTKDETPNETPDRPSRTPAPGQVTVTPTLPVATSTTMPPPPTATNQPPPQSTSTDPPPATEPPPPPEPTNTTSP